MQAQEIEQSKTSVLNFKRADFNKSLSLRKIPWKTILCEMKWNDLLEVGLAIVLANMNSKGAERDGRLLGKSALKHRTGF